MLFSLRKHAKNINHNERTTNDSGSGVNVNRIEDAREYYTDVLGNETDLSSKDAQIAHLALSLIIKFDKTRMKYQQPRKIMNSVQ